LEKNDIDLLNVKEFTQRRQFMGPSHPSNVKREEDHDFSLDWDFMPLSTPVSEVEAMCRLVEEEISPTFFRTLWVLIGEISIPNPRDQARCFSWRIPEAGEGCEGRQEVVPCSASKPQ
jgi:hypothetical protein